jgi:hypothetical protein
VITANNFTVQSEYSNITFLPSIAVGYSWVIIGPLLGLLLVLGQDGHLVLF